MDRLKNTIYHLFYKTHTTECMQHIYFQSELVQPSNILIDSIQFILIQLIQFSSIGSPFEKWID